MSMPLASNPQEIEKEIFQLVEGDSEAFADLALRIFSYQYWHTPIYQKWCLAMHKHPDNVTDLTEIPFLPISFFRSHTVLSDEFHKAEVTFKSSGSTSDTPSLHWLAKAQLYETSILKGFEYAFGPPSEYLFLSLLPNYLERGDSSLVYMMNFLQRNYGKAGSGFYLQNFSELRAALAKGEQKQQKILLVGVTYALLDFAEEFSMAYPGLTVMETGGMKGRRNEITRPELHATLQKAFPHSLISSEYGMTELLSQAYFKNGSFSCPPWMRVMIREPQDPLSAARAGRTGGINVIDLANLYSCSFIETQDLGRTCMPESFEVLGRFDNAEARGCSLLIAT